MRKGQGQGGYIQPIDQPHDGRELNGICTMRDSMEWEKLSQLTHRVKRIVSTIATHAVRVLVLPCSG